MAGTPIWGANAVVRRVNGSSPSGEVQVSTTVRARRRIALPTLFIFAAVASLLALGMVDPASAAPAENRAVSSPAKVVAQPKCSPAESPGSETDAAPDLETIDEIDLSSGHFAPAPRTNTPMAELPVITAGDCQYKQAVDHAHVTRGEASVHGWWIHWAGSCPSTATSTVHLQAYWCDQLGCRWVTVRSGSRSAGPGTARRANARWGCASNATVGWRGAVDVDLDWQVDPPGLTYSPPRNLSCAPS